MPCFKYYSSDINGHLLTGHSAQTDRTLSLHHPVVSSKVLETFFFDWTRPVMLDRTLPTSGHTETFFCVVGQYDQTQPYSVRSLSDPASGQEPTLESSLLHMTGRAGPPEASVRSLYNQRHLLLFTSIYFTLAQMFQPPSVSHCAHVLAYFHKHFQGC